MKTTALIHKLPSGNSSVISAEKILEMATINGAKVMSLDNKVGSIEISKQADLILLNLKKPNTTPITEPLSVLIVYNGKANNVDTAIINGEIVMRKGQMLTVDETEVIKMAQQSMDRLNKT
jgi:5-methylthioadenosine/S-adenosylhomocysteine deaminase